MNRTHTLRNATLTLVAIAIAAPAFAGKKDIVDTAVSAGSFNTLVAALKAADLVDALKGNGPFTVFAPTDEAFAKLPKGTLDMLLKPENKGKLTAILTYHVVSGNVMSAQAAQLSAAKTLNGQQIDIARKGNGLTIDGANVAKADIACSNGVIHVIDSVILPSDKNIVETAVAAGSFKTLATALQAAGLVDALQGDGPFTVFAPTDAAFAKLPAGTVESLLKPENREKLAAVLKFHVVAGRAFAADALATGEFKTLGGQMVRVRLQDGKPFVNDAPISATDIDASNGVIHVIDSVLLPENLGSIGAAHPRRMIEMAIERGAPAFNRGHVELCSTIYEQTARELMQVSGTRMPCSARDRLARALNDAQRTHDHNERAWIFRHALDEIYASM